MGLSRIKKDRHYCNLRRFAGVSEAGVRSRNPERKRRICLAAAIRECLRAKRMLLAFLYHTFNFLRPKRHFVFYLSANIGSRSPKTTSGYSFIFEDNETCQNASARSIFLLGNLIQ